MALSERIVYEGDNSTFIWKYPHEDFNCMTELVVHESQEAIFFANGVAADVFGPGRYKLDAKNIPILTGLVNIVTGVAVFHAEVYFINKTVQMAVKWGTADRVRFIEPTLGLPVEIGASGEMNLAVKDSRKLLLTVVGTMKGISWEEENGGFSKSLQKSFRPLIATAVKTHLPAAIKNKQIDLAEVDEHLEELSAELRGRILPGFEEYGLTIPQFYITAIAWPDNDPNFKRLMDLHTISLQKRMTQAEAEVRAARAESRAAAETAEAAASAQIAAAKRGAVLEEQTTETEVARREAERELIRAQTEAQRTQLQGMAEAAVMQAQGYTKKDVLQADVQKAFAEGIGNMGPLVGSSGGSSAMGDMLGLGVGMAAMGAIMPNMANVMKGFSAQAQEAAPAAAPSEAAVKCPNCGRQLPEGARFCPECGAKTDPPRDNETLCPHCGQKTPKGKFCISCGQPLVNKCPGCGAELPPGAKFCLECGTKL